MTATGTCHVCGCELEFSVVAAVTGYCDVCRPDECPECGCKDVRQRAIRGDETDWRCDNGCLFSIPT